MKKFVDKGEYFALSIYKILQNPLVIETTEMRNPAQVICEDAFYLSPTGNGETSIEILRIAGDFKGSEILHFVVFRTHSSVESECVLRQEALLQGALACLHHAGYVVEEVAYEQYRACQKHVYDKAFTARNYGVGQAEALILFVIVALISGVQIYIGKKKEVEA